jgi:hypothetical protein
MIHPTRTEDDSEEEVQTLKRRCSATFGIKISPHTFIESNGRYRNEERRFNRSSRFSHTIRRISI